MSFIPHTENDIREMLNVIGIHSLDELFDEIPKDLFVNRLENIPNAMSEMQVKRFMLDRSKKNADSLCFIGAGAYEHHIPAAVWDIASRGEFLTAYTPYQSEASQGTLQTIFEFQTMMASLTGMDVSNASMYDGASSLAEAILMAVRCNRNSHSKKILIPLNVHPHYRDTIKTIVSSQKIECAEFPFDAEDGEINITSLKQYEDEDITALVISQPNFFGVIENADILTDWAHQRGILVIAVVNPIALALFKEPGSWGNGGADIVCGEGQPLGSPLSCGGPYFGFLCCKQAYMRQMPGRIVGRTTDADGNVGYVLTLQAREQHIRRAKATSNICSNEGLMVTAATIYLSLFGPKGLRQVAEVCHTQTRKLVEKIKIIKGVEIIFQGPFFHEVVLKFSKNFKNVISFMLKNNIQPGLDLSPYYPELKNCLLVCCTEMKSDDDINQYVDVLNKALK